MAGSPGLLTTKSNGNSNKLQEVIVLTSPARKFSRRMISGVWGDWSLDVIGITDSISTTSSFLAASATAVKAANDAASDAKTDASTALARTAPATTTARGIGRVATSADMVDGATITNGPAFLAAGVNASIISSAFNVPIADENGRLNDSWLLRAAPTGFSGFYAGDTPPDGWLEENGAPISRTTYARLFAIIGTRYGSGNGSTTFNLPDTRALVKRVWDHGRGIDVGRALGSVQQDEVKNHTHALGAGPSHVQSTPNQDYSDVGRGEQLQYSGYYTAYFGAPENTVKNMSLMGIIKY